MLRRCLRNYFSLYRASDPYYILGVDKKAQFSEIKKKFYEYANIYHPDKNLSSDGSQFLLIKEAFEQIKAQRGLAIAQNIQKSQSQFDSQHQSVRPHAYQYNEKNEEAHPNFTSTTDYKIYNEKIPDGEMYDKFRQSFTTIDDINDIKIKVEKGEMKDNMARLGLQIFRAKIQGFSNSGTGPMVIIVFSGAFLIWCLNVHLNLSQDTKHIDAVKMLQKAQGNFIRSNNEYSQQQVNLIQKDKDYMKFKREKGSEQNDLKFLSGSEPVFNPQLSKTL